MQQRRTFGQAAGWLLTVCRGGGSAKAICLSTLLAMFNHFNVHAAVEGSPSFNCRDATTADEFAICRSSRLSQLDQLLDMGHRHLIGTIGRTEVLPLAQALLKQRQGCGANSDCIMAKQIGAIQTFQALGAKLTMPKWVPSPSAPSEDDTEMPDQIGQCVSSMIESIGGRLEGDTEFLSGTSVAFTNGGYQVSYDRVEAIVNSRPADKVKICLVRIPENCPPGDNRGKVYITRNERTGLAWTLEDSQHSCGGA